MKTHHSLSAHALVALPLAVSVACAARGPRGAEALTDTAALATEGKSMEDLFAGRFPGVTVARAGGGGLQIRIRGGNNTFYAGDEPLYVLDDTPLPASANGIVFINPHDIEKIEVLKNPADLALYGIRGGNGVVKITTKKPRPMK